MPYRLNPLDKRCVEKQESRRWVLIKCHLTIEEARKHLQALQANVEHKK